MMSTHKRKLLHEENPLLLKKPCARQDDGYVGNMIQMSLEIEKKDQMIFQMAMEIKKMENKLCQLSSQTCKVCQGAITRAKDPCSYIH